MDVQIQHVMEWNRDHSDNMRFKGADGSNITSGFVVICEGNVEYRSLLSTAEDLAKTWRGLTKAMR